MSSLERAGGKLGDIVQMKVFITDVRYGDRLTEIPSGDIRRQFPQAALLITITGLANPDAQDRD